MKALLPYRKLAVTVLVAGGLCTLIVLSKGDGVRPSGAAMSAGGDARIATSARHAAVEGGTSVAVPQAIDPALFSSGACLALPPTNGDVHKTVFLDAGHGGIDPGGVGTTESGAQVTESVVNLAIELDTAAILRAEGYRVVVSRTQNTTVTALTPGDVSGGLLTVQGAFNDVAARDVCANMAGADLLLGIYMDSGSSWNAGCVTGYDASRPFSADNLRFATLLQNDVLGAMNAKGYGIPDEGVQPDTVLGSALTDAALAYGHLLLLGPAKSGYFSTPSQMPGALIEPLFLTDPFEGSVAVSARGQQVIAGALAEAVTQYFAAPSSLMGYGVRSARSAQPGRLPSPVVCPARSSARPGWPGRFLTRPSSGRGCMSELVFLSRKNFLLRKTTSEVHVCPERLSA
jgi:N-acetylmuramoyl-L-alanine amidase